jgi:hypothetical protein
MRVLLLVFFFFDRMTGFTGVSGGGGMLRMALVLERGGGGKMWELRAVSCAVRVLRLFFESGRQEGRKVFLTAKDAKWVFGF